MLTASLILRRSLALTRESCPERTALPPVVPYRQNNPIASAALALAWGKSDTLGTLRASPEMLYAR
jgi:hypothetical protein